MRAVVDRKPFEVAVEEVLDPRIQQPNDVIVRITSTCICGSDLHMADDFPTGYHGCEVAGVSPGRPSRSTVPGRSA